jgi:2-oxoglutarate dehydrogenase complex dehydrogenase (E1) component-like enzyme
VWVQEEPSNMGAWAHVRAVFDESWGRSFAISCMARPPAPSPAAGYVRKHVEEQRNIVRAAFDDTAV